MSVTVQEVKQAIATLEDPGAFLGILPRANAVDVLKRSGRLQGKNLAEVDSWGVQQILARLNTLLMEMRS